MAKRLQKSAETPMGLSLAFVMTLEYFGNVGFCTVGVLGCEVSLLVCDEGIVLILEGI